MNNIYNESILKVKEGAKFRINLKTRTLYLDGKAVINGGQYEGELGIEPTTTSAVLERVEELYAIYKHSIPSQRSESRNHRYFKALPEHMLTDEEMCYGESREVAQISLELYLLICLINGSFVWNEETVGKWYFWQSQKDKDLVILKSQII